MRNPPSIACYAQGRPPVPFGRTPLPNRTPGFALRESTRQLPIEPPNDCWPLGIISPQFFILRPLDGGDSLVLCYAACNRLRNGVTDIRQHPSITGELF